MFETIQRTLAYCYIIPVALYDIIRSWLPNNPHLLEKRRRQKELNEAADKWNASARRAMGKYD